MFCRNGVHKISQNSQENTCARVSFLRVSFLTVLIRLQALIYKIREACNFIKKRLCYRFFSVNFSWFLRTPFFTEHLWWLLLIPCETQWFKYDSASHGRWENSNLFDKKFVTLACFCIFARKHRLVSLICFSFNFNVYHERENGSLQRRI